MIKTKIINYLKNYNPELFESEENHGKIKISDVIDSFGMIELIIFLEKSFSFEINDLDVTSKNFSTIDSLVNFIETSLEE